MSRTSRTSTVESLEQRRLLSTVTLDNGVLIVQGDRNVSSLITVRPVGSNLVAAANSNSRTFAASSVTSIRLIGGQLADTITVDPAISRPAYVEAGGGNDSVTTGAGPDTVFGLDGDDVLNGGSGNDRLFGGDGNDIVRGGNGDDQLFGNAGNDNLDGQVGNDFLYGAAGTNTLADPRVFGPPAPVGPTIDVRSYGAKLNGVTDDAAAIQRAIAAIPASGGTLLIPGVAAIGASGVQISNRSNITVRGQSAGNGFKSLAPTGHIQDFQAAVLSVRSSTACTVRDLTFNGNGIATTQLSITNSSSCVALNNTITGVGAAIAAVYGIGNTNNQYLNNRLTDIGSRGLYIGWISPSGMERSPIVSGNSVIRPRSSAIGITATDAYVLDNTVTDARGAGIAISSGTQATTTRVVVAGNTLLRNLYHGIQSDTPGSPTVTDDVVVTDNNSSSNYVTGVFVVRATRWIVNSNTIQNNGAIPGGEHGVSVIRARNVSVIDNDISDTRTGSARTQDIGVFVNSDSKQYPTTDVRVAFNSSRNHTRDGISVRAYDSGNIDRISIFSNDLVSNSGYGIRAIQDIPGGITRFSQEQNSFSNNALGTVFRNF